MTRFYTVAFSGLFLFAIACNSTTDSSSGSGADSSKVITAPVDNANATNPSAADTVYPKKDTMITKGDSIRKEK